MNNNKKIFQASPNIFEYILTTLFIIITLIGYFIGLHYFVIVGAGLFALLFAILLTPLVNFFILRLRIPNVIASTISVVLFTAIIAFIITIVSIQIGDFSGEIKNIKTNISIHYQSIQTWVKDSFNISYNQQNKYIKDVKSNSLNTENIITENRITSITDILLNFLLVPLYTFLFFII